MSPSRLIVATLTIAMLAIAGIAAHFSARSGQLSNIELAAAPPVTPPEPAGAPVAHDASHGTTSTSADTGYALTPLGADDVDLSGPASSEADATGGGSTSSSSSDASAADDAGFRDATPTFIGAMSSGGWAGHTGVGSIGSSSAALFGGGATIAMARRDANVAPDTTIQKGAASPIATMPPSVGPTPPAPRNGPSLPPSVPVGTVNPTPAISSPTLPGNTPGNTSSSGSIVAPFAPAVTNGPGTPAVNVGTPLTPNATDVSGGDDRDLDDPDDFANAPTPSNAGTPPVPPGGPGSNTIVSSSARISPTPEPATLLLLGFGGALAARGRARRSRR